MAWFGLAPLAQEASGSWVDRAEELLPYLDHPLALLLGGLVALLILIKVLSGLWGLVDRILSSKSTFIGRRRIRRQAEKLRGHEPRKAGDLFREIGETSEALDCYEKAGAWRQAGNILLDRGQRRRAARALGKAGEHARAADLFLEVNEPARAAREFLEAGNRVRAARAYEDAGKLQKAIKIHRELNRFDRAADLLARVGNPDEAAEMAEETFFSKLAEVSGSGFEGRREVRELVDRIDGLYREASDLESLLRFYVRAGMLVEAAEVCIEREELDRAADFYMKAGEEEKAALLYEQSGEEEKAASILGELHLRSDRIEEAADAFERAGEPDKAAECFERAEEWGRAAAIYEKIGNYSQAAWLWAKADEPAKAAELYEATSDWMSALQCYEMVEDRQGMARVMGKSGQNLRAGELHYEEGELDAAAETLREIPEDDDRYRDAASLLGVIFFEKGMYRAALQKFEEGVVEDSDTGKLRLDLLYYRARTYEELGRIDDALESYETITEIDRSFRDVGDRVDAIRKGRRPEPSRLRLVEEAETAGAGAGNGDTLRMSDGAGQEEGVPLGSPPEARGGDTVVDPSGPDPEEGETTPADQLDGLLLNKGRYKILEEIGRGGMGVVYKVRDTLLDRIVAYKVLSTQISDFPKAVEHFLREAKSAARMNHPNVVTLYDFGENSGRYFMTLEYVSGRDLREYTLFNGRPAIPEALRIVDEICAGLAYAHAMNVIHRDIKPSNVMITDMDGRLKILDFGLAKVIEDVAPQASGVLGTPWYMSPEQVQGEVVDHRADLYSVGVLAFELMTGELPFSGRDFGYHHVHTEPRDPRELDESIPSDVAELVLTCLEKDPDDRFQSADELREAIAGLLEE